MNIHDKRNPIRDLAAEYGIASTYRDGIGQQRTMAPGSLASLLTTLGVQANSSHAVHQRLDEVGKRGWKRLVDDVSVIVEGTRRPTISLSIPLGPSRLSDVSLSWEITDENGVAENFSCTGETCRPAEKTIINHERYVRIHLALRTPLALGYYWMLLRVGMGHRHLEGRTFLIVAPRRCYLPSNPVRSFGVAAQLYNLNTEKNWGIGDLRDLKAFVTWSGRELHVGAVGVSPLHEPAAGVNSPYSPSSRLFFNPLYLDVEAIPEFRSTPAIQRYFGSARFQNLLRELRQSPLVQYERVMAVKNEVLESLYQAFKRQHLRVATRRSRAFEAYCRNGGVYLKQFAAFQILGERFGSGAWREWPEEYWSPNSPSVEHVIDRRRDRMQYYQYLQWQCEVQLRGLDQTARRMNLAWGLYHDLPVGVHPDGADSWMFQDELASSLTVGAPPDSFNVHGQNWGLMAPVPWLMRRAGYRFFIETIRRNMRYGGMLRIDHALGLFRLFVIPHGSSGEDGTYMKMPVEELLAILALESVKHQVVVVGEDLGTVTPEIRRRLAKANVLSYRLMPFEKTPSGAFRSPRQFPSKAIASFTTHDLPTLTGYWAGRDIETKGQAGLYQTEIQREQDWERRNVERVAFVRALTKEGFLLRTTLKCMPLQAPYAFTKGAYAYLARTRCRMLMIPLEDLIGELEAPNLPGALAEAYPSWRIRLGRSFEAFRRDPQIYRLLDVIKAERCER